MNIYCLSIMLLPVVLAMLIARWLRGGRSSRRVCVVVLGDIGRSPRMQYHALSLAGAGYQVNIVGYGDSSPVSDVRNHKSIQRVHMLAVPAILDRLPRMIALLVKVIWQSVTLISCLLCASRPSHILLQNPPSLPSIAVCYVAAMLRGCELIIDWHNYGYTRLSLVLGPRHPLVRIYQTYERFCGRLSTANICVTDAMRKDLLSDWCIQATTMHDRPPDIFRTISLEEKHAFFQKLDIFGNKDCSLVDGEMNQFTRKDVIGQVSYREDRPALLVSSTSWTEEEDFSMLLSALDRYDKACAGCKETRDGTLALPHLVCVITGKGPLKQFYTSEIEGRQWSHVTVHTPWLEAEDYPTMLACADLGVSLHYSSSGLDLPMKVVDMFGCGLPVCAINFKCLGELVKENENGLVFDNDEQLSQQLQTLLRGFPDDCRRLATFRENLKSFQQLRWTESWTNNVLPLFS